MKNGIKIGIGMMIVIMLICVVLPMNVAAETCSRCDGTGDCQQCGGDGSDWLETCTDCEGTGICQDCDGDGEVLPGFELLGAVLAIGICVGIIGRKRRKK